PKNNCPDDRDTVFVRVYQELSLPNTFSPNDDGTNDFWNITPLSAYPQSVLTVYHRLGKVVVRTKGNAESWDGKFENKDLPAGTYYYVLDFGESDKKSLTGWVSIIR